jgi:DNA-binding XRE family transcriptional regulator
MDTPAFTRRDFLRLGTVVLGGLWLACRPGSVCTLLSMDCGPSHLDLWDLKPAAPAAVHGEFQPITMSVQRIIRDRRLTPEEAAKYKAVREQVAEELPDLIARHHERLAVLDQLQALLEQLKAARQAKGLSLADLTERTGMDRSALSKLETGQRPNPTIETLVRYAEAVGKRLVLTLAEASGCD